MPEIPYTADDLVWIACLALGCKVAELVVGCTARGGPECSERRRRSHGGTARPILPMNMNELRGRRGRGRPTR